MLTKFLPKLVHIFFICIVLDILSFIWPFWLFNSDQIWIRFWRILVWIEPADRSVLCSIRVTEKCSFVLDSRYPRQVRPSLLLVFINHLIYFSRKYHLLCIISTLRGCNLGILMATSLCHAYRWLLIVPCWWDWHLAVIIELVLIILWSRMLTESRLVAHAWWLSHWNLIRWLWLSRVHLIVAWLLIRHEIGLILDHGLVRLITCHRLLIHVVNIVLSVLWMSLKSMGHRLWVLIARWSKEHVVVWRLRRHPRLLTRQYVPLSLWVHLMRVMMRNEMRLRWWVQRRHWTHALSCVLSLVRWLTTIWPTCHIDVDLQRLIPLPCALRYNVELRFHVSIDLNIVRTFTAPSRYARPFLLFLLADITSIRTSSSSMLFFLPRCRLSLIDLLPALAVFSLFIKFLGASVLDALSMLYGLAFSPRDILILRW